MGLPGNAVSSPVGPHIQAPQPSLLIMQVRRWPAWTPLHRLTSRRLTQLSPSPGAPQGLKEAKKQDLVLPAMDAIRDLLQVGDDLGPLSLCLSLI